ncbi:DUF1566 domain-containing protein [Patiriisocius sp. Uisw_017]|uniref:Lcl C-terminal domain-containing protein n=1 Tax=Patiriisocius sp. Uisw_017 TaxID=3230968 RepID=UPI0039EB239C
MKRFTFALLLLCSMTTFAQQGINYKALIKDGSGVIVSSTAIDVTFTILDGASNVYEETHAPTTDANGIVILNIGEGTPVTGDFSTIDWSSNSHFLKVQIDTGGGLQDMGATAFKTVPYALHAKTAESVTSTCGLSIGDTYQGGIIFYLDGSGCHGLVAKASDETGFYEWSPINFDTWAFANGIFGGAQNTKKSIARASDNSSLCPAADQCEGLSDGGFTDWYLPSKDELDMMYVNLRLQGLGGFSGGFYWSSTEFNNDFAWRQNFGNGLQDYFIKFNAYDVRAVRAF